MPRIDTSESRLLFVIIVGAFLGGLCLAVLGLYLVSQGGAGEATVEILGQRLNSNNAGITAIFIGAVLIIFLVRPAYNVLMRPQTQHDSLITLLQSFQKGTGNATENVAMIERIANSNNQNKRDYLMQASQVQAISFMEVDAINLALTDLDNGIVVANLLRRCRDLELPKIMAMVPDNDDSQYKTIVTTFKYDRYISRKDSPDYDKLSEFLAESLAHGYFTERSKKLAKEIRQKRMLEQGLPASLVGTKSTPFVTETSRDRAIRLAAVGDYSAGMDAATEALEEDQSLVSDAKFVFALARCSASLGDLKTALIACQLLIHKNPSAQEDTEFHPTLSFLKDKGLTI